MAHKILGNRFIARAKPAWHNIAKRIFGENEVITAREAMAEVAGDVEIVRAPVSYEIDGQQIRADKQQAIVRKPVSDDNQHRLLGFTAESWVAASYTELAGALDPLSKEYKVETAGLLKKGGLAFLCFRAEDWAVKGDEMRSYFAANFSLTPGIGHKVFHSPVRVVCWNTNTMAESQASINLSIPHSTDSLQRIELAARLVGQFHEMKDKTQEIFEAFADRHISTIEANAIFAAAYPDPSMPSKLKFVKQSLNETESETFKQALTPSLLIALEQAQETYDRACANAVALRETAVERMEAFEPANLRGTAWAAYNAVTEVSDWREGRNADVSAVMGTRSREKSRAFAEAMVLVS